MEYFAPTYLIFLFVAMMACLEVGRRFGSRHPDRASAGDAEKRLLKLLSSASSACWSLLLFPARCRDSIIGGISSSKKRTTSAPLTCGSICLHPRTSPRSVIYFADISLTPGWRLIRSCLISKRRSV